MSDTTTIWQEYRPARSNRGGRRPTCDRCHKKQPMWTNGVERICDWCKGANRPRNIFRRGELAAMSDGYKVPPLAAHRNGEHSGLVDTDCWFCVKGWDELTTKPRMLDLFCGAGMAAEYAALAASPSPEPEGK